MMLFCSYHKLPENLELEVKQKLNEIILTYPVKQILSGGLGNRIKFS